MTRILFISSSFFLLKKVDLFLLLLYVPSLYMVEKKILLNNFKLGVIRVLIVAIKVLILIIAYFDPSICLLLGCEIAQSFSADKE